MTETKCVSTKRSISNDTGSVAFPCPGCGETITRSTSARKNVAPYKCAKCEFMGP